MKTFKQFSEAAVEKKFGDKKWTRGGRRRKKYFLWGKTIEVKDDGWQLMKNIDELLSGIESWKSDIKYNIYFADREDNRTGKWGTFAQFDMSNKYSDIKVNDAVNIVYHSEIMFGRTNSYEKTQNVAHWLAHDIYHTMDKFSSFYGVPGNLKALEVQANQALYYGLSELVLTHIGEVGHKVTPEISDYDVGLQGGIMSYGQARQKVIKRKFWFNKKVPDIDSSKDYAVAWAFDHLLIDKPHDRKEFDFALWAEFNNELWAMFLKEGKIELKKHDDIPEADRSRVSKEITKAYSDLLNALKGNVIIIDGR